MRELDAGDQIGDVETALENLKAWDINNRALLRPFLYAGSMAQEANAGKPVYRRELPTRIFDNSTGPVRVVTPQDSLANSVSALMGNSLSYGYNETAWDRWRNNTEVTLLASAVRTADTNTADQTNFNHKGLILNLNVTVVPTTETIRLRLEYKEPVTGDYVTMAQTTADADAGNHFIYVYPGNPQDTFQGSQQDVVLDLPMPRTWRAVANVSSTGNWTFSMSAVNIV